MSMQNDFKTFVSNISNLDFEDIDTKCKGITKKLNSHYYEVDSETDNSKKVGSIGRETAIKGISDLDMLYEIPEERFNDFKKYETNEPSQLLQEIKNVLLEKYSRTDIKGDGQVVVVDFDSQHVEVVPCHKISEFTYEYPDTHDSGTWHVTSPDLDIQKIKLTNKKLSKMKEQDDYHLRDIFGKEFPISQTLNEDSCESLSKLFSFTNPEQFIEEAKPRIKELFDYEIPIAMVNDAGITTTGAASENNELPILAEEFAAYRKRAKLWESYNLADSYDYNAKQDGAILRSSNGNEENLVW